MIKAFFYAIVQSLKVLWWTVRYLPSEGIQYVPKRLLILGLGIPLFILLQLLHWLCFLIDEIVFFKYRIVKVRNPLFIVGVPRSGTTFLQRTMEKESLYTTTRAWECLFAPSITQRYFIKFIGLLFKPFRRVGTLISVPFLKKMESIHELGLSEAEEDFLLLFPVFSCFILIAFFPHADGLWKLAYFDEKMSERHKKIIMNYYFRCVQKHLYFHKDAERYLSKNPSFSSMVKSLNARFQDADFVACFRTPLATVPSQLSSLRPSMKMVGSDRFSDSFKANIMSMLHHYYSHLLGSLSAVDPEIPFIEMNELNENLMEVMERIYKYTDISMSQEVYEELLISAEKSSKYKSKHKYNLEEFNLNEGIIQNRFSDIWPISKFMHSKTETSVEGD